MANFWTLREANVARNIEWTGGAGVSFTFRSTELSGECAEVGELFLVAPHNTPEPGEGMLGWATEWRGKLTEEIADGIICVDLTGMKLGFPGIPHEEDVDPHFIRHYGDYDNVKLLAILGIRCGLIGNTMKKLERAANGWVGSKAKPDDAWAPLFEVHCILREIARRYGVNVQKAVADKFTATSEKYGLTTRLLA
jgi:hypothetical protein